MSCAVCLHDKRIAKNTRTRNSCAVIKTKVGQTPMWCPQCRAHACHEHREDVHLLTMQGVELFEYHNEVRVGHTWKKTGKKQKI